MKAEALKKLFGDEFPAPVDDRFQLLSPCAEGLSRLTLPPTTQKQTPNNPGWVIEAAQLPLAFAQVREDSLLDLAVLEQTPRPARMIMVASGGCTAASLAASARLSHLHLVDPNPAQLALAGLKLHLLQHAPTAERLSLLGHAPMEPEERSIRLGEILQGLKISRGDLGPAAILARWGPDHAGRYEMVFAALRNALARFASEMESLLSLRDVAEQARRVSPETRFGQALDQSFAEIMTLPNLVHLFGPDATANRTEEFSRHFARRTRHALATLPAAENPYLAQLLLGRFQNGVTSHWLSAKAATTMPVITWSATTMQQALKAVSTESCDVVHLSNILDWLSPAAAADMLADAWRTLVQDGFVTIRQLNSTLDVPAAGRQFEWLTAKAEQLHQRDRSFFYRAIHLGRKT